MNKIINRFLLTGDKVMPELHLKSQHLLIVLVGHLLNIVKEFKNWEETGNWKQFKIFKDRVYEIARNRKYDGY